MKLSDVKPISYVKANAAEVLDKLSTSRAPMGITQHGEIKAVMVSVEEYQRTQDTLALLKLIALGEADISSGNARPLNDFRKEVKQKLGR